MTAQRSAKVETLLHAQSNQSSAALQGTTVLLIGDVTGPAFAPLREQLISEDARHAPTLSAALELIDGESWLPEIVVVWQGVPDEYPRSQAERLIGRLPLARWVVVFGPWCESIGRTEQLWPVAWTVPLRHAATRLQAVLQDSGPPLPATMSRDEAFAAHHTLSDRHAFADRALTACVTGDDVEFCEFLSDAVTAMGIELSGRHDASLLILHVSVPDAGTCQKIAACRSQSPDARLVVVSELITPQTERQIRQAGADVVFTQLRFASEFAAWL